MPADSNWFAAVVTRDINCDEYCPLCDGKKFNCTECEQGRAVSHMWGGPTRGPFFKKDSKVIVARRDSFFSEHEWRGIHMSIKYPEMYYVFEPNVSGRKVRVTRAYAAEHLSRVRPLKDFTKLGEEALDEWLHQMSR